MTSSDRRDFLRQLGIAAGACAAGASLTVFPPVIRKALAVPANRRTRSIKDVEHVVILMQENRSFDHYFGSLRGVRGFADRFPIPRVDAPGISKNTVWFQSNGATGRGPRVLAPFRLNTQETFDYMRISGTPHTWPNAQHAWADGKLHEWPRHKQDHSMGYFGAEDIPFQFAMAEAFTLCDAYHCSLHGGTNPNRVFLWSGTNDPLQSGGGPVITNDYDNLEHDPSGGYSWITYPERLQKAGISWQVYENMADNFTDNPLAGFQQYRAAINGLPGSLAALKERGLSTRDLDKLRDDVIEGKLPQVSWIVATAEGSEHPGPSSPAQGADYTARVLEALTADPKVWSKTVLFVNFDENDGFFDHVPPPAAPSYVSWDADRRKAILAGDSTVNTSGEYHEFLAPNVDDEGRELQHKPYGLGPRVPMYVLSPWSKGGWVNSEVFDHTSVIRFLEQRFGVLEPNISPFRRAVCGDLSSAFDFSDPDASDFDEDLPDTTELAERARALTQHATPPTPDMPALPVQEYGVRPSRALPYELHTHAEVDPETGSVRLLFANSGQAGAVFHVYDRRHLERIPRRYAVEPRKKLSGQWETRAEDGAYDLWVLGPNGYHRHFTGNCYATRGAGLGQPEIEVGYHVLLGSVSVTLRNRGSGPCAFLLRANAYFRSGPWLVDVAPHGEAQHVWPLRHSAHWYDFSVIVRGLAGYSRRFAGRLETGRDSVSDPAMGGRAIGAQLAVE
jgi:phospholipase C